VEGLAQVRGPVVKGPPSVQEVVGAAADDPRKGGHAGDHVVVGGMPAKVVVTDGKKEPDQEGVEESARGAHGPEADDA
jgi:hypothetical protein